MKKKVNLDIVLKAVVIGVLVLIMLIPLYFVSNAIEKRAQYRSEAEDKITDSWGGNILIAAPILNVPYFHKTTAKSSDGKTIESGEWRYLKIMPSDLNADVSVSVQTRYIGIFEMPVYTAEITMKGSFDDFKSMIPSTARLQDSFLTLEINELKGLSAPVLLWNGKSKDFEPGYFGSGLKFDIDRGNRYSSTERTQFLNAPILLSDSGNAFELKFSVKGSRQLTFVPVGQENIFHIKSNWDSPSFSGSFLPDSKELNKDGFSANWNISYLASSIPSAIEAGNTLNAPVLSTAFLIPVDNYRNALRAQKYGILFIILTFVICFVFEMANKKPIHPIQYLLVGFAMSVFYILLVSLSDFMFFGLAYFIAAFATVFLITAYAKIGIAKDMKPKACLIVALSLSFLYGYLYVLLQMEDFSLLIGSIGLFIALAVIMYMTRNINWYEEQQ
ncbi:MAG: cell envelope integrity protein CreD [Elusimicrobiota bacterium]|jgi:inner membrane protein|nr:cell envelope integrity protein CreD [Elusimicrobiota bacterium]